MKSLVYAVKPEMGDTLVEYISRAVAIKGGRKLDLSAGVHSIQRGD